MSAPQDSSEEPRLSREEIVERLVDQLSRQPRQVEFAGIAFLRRFTFRIVAWSRDKDANVDQSVSLQLLHDHEGLTGNTSRCWLPRRAVFQRSLDFIRIAAVDCYLTMIFPVI